MKVLMISGDKHLLDPGSEAGKRLALQRAEVDQLDVFVWPRVHGIRSIFKAAGANHYDVITAQDPLWRGHIAWHVSQKARARLNLQVHMDLAALPAWKRAWARVHLRRADSIRVVSEKLKREVEAIDVHAPIHVLPVYVDLERFRNLQPKPHAQKTILWVGRFETEKDPLYALEVLKGVRAQGLDAKLVMLGSGALEPVLQGAVGGLPVELPGWQDPRPYLQGADVVLSTSRHESWGASVVEALAAGVPVVAPDVGVAREAGARIAARAELAKAVAEVVRSGARGELKLKPLSAAEWAEAWKQTL